MWLRIESGELIQLNHFAGIGVELVDPDWSVVAYKSSERAAGPVLADGFETKDLALGYIDALHKVMATGTAIAIHAQLVAISEEARK